jgi:hypothetical protein
MSSVCATGSDAATFAQRASLSQQEKRLSVTQDPNRWCVESLEQEWRRSVQINDFGILCFVALGFVWGYLHRWFTDLERHKKYRRYMMLNHPSWDEQDD